MALASNTHLVNLSPIICLSTQQIFIMHLPRARDAALNRTQSFPDQAGLSGGKKEKIKQMHRYLLCLVVVSAGNRVGVWGGDVAILYNMGREGSMIRWPVTWLLREGRSLAGKPSQFLPAHKSWAGGKLGHLGEHQGSHLAALQMWFLFCKCIFSPHLRCKLLESGGSMVEMPGDAIFSKTPLSEVHPSVVCILVPFPQPLPQTLIGLLALACGTRIS